MTMQVRIVSPSDPDFKKLFVSGQLVAGVDINVSWANWNGEEKPVAAEPHKEKSYGHWNGKRPA